MAKKIYETSDLTIFNLLKENRGFTFDIETAINCGKTSNSVSRFRRRVNSFKKHFEDINFSEFVILPVWKDNDGKLFLGDGATRITALKELHDEGKIEKPTIQYQIFTNKDFSKEEFIEKMMRLNTNNGHKWDINDKVEYAAYVWNSEIALKAIELKQKYNIGMFLITDTLFNKQGTSKQNYNFEKAVMNSTPWSYSEEFFDFLVMLHRNCVTDFKKKIFCEKSVTILRQIFSLITSQKDKNSDAIKRELDLTKDILMQSINTLDKVKNTSLKDWWCTYLKVITTNKKEYYKLSDSTKIELMNKYNNNVMFR
jgi:hypothetical protein